MAPTPAGLDPVKLQVLHPRLGLPSLIRCQTPINSLIYWDNFGNYVSVTDSLTIKNWHFPLLYTPLESDQTLLLSQPVHRQYPTDFFP